MSYLKSSPECIKSELDVFLMPPLNTSIEQGQFESIKPIINKDGTIEFNVVGTDDYIDLSKCYVDLTAKVYKKTDMLSQPKLEAGDTVGPINNFFH